MATTFEAPPGLRASAALLPEGWVRNVDIRFDAYGSIASITPAETRSATDLLTVHGPVLPGAVNVHSHAFQRALVGRVQRLRGTDDFWTWRDLMLRLAGRLTPEDLESIARRLYREMLGAGYTSVAEFHYLHHDRGGRPYDQVGEMSLRLAAAARAIGIGCTLLPVLYRWSGFDRAPIDGPRERFRCSLDTYERLVEVVRQASREHGHDWGLAPHSLRAVSADDLRHLTEIADGVPVHIHVSEQIGEVEDCLAFSGRRPIEFLFETVRPDARWCLVHATHTDASERRLINDARVCIGLCPTTEGDLGDGFFPFGDWLDISGRWGIGSDSHVSVSPGEELRLLLYTERMRRRKRGVIGGDCTMGDGTMLWSRAAHAGGTVVGRNAGSIAPGKSADLVVLSEDAPLLAGLDPDAAANAFVLSGGAAEIDRVIVSGRVVVRDGHHREDAAIRDEWSRTAARLATYLE